MHYNVLILNMIYGLGIDTVDGHNLIKRSLKLLTSLDGDRHQIITLALG